jgi:hypothetical protein
MQPTERSEAGRKWQLQWTGDGASHWNSSLLKPIQFCPAPQ